MPIIFDVQRFSIHDGPGIRTTVFFKGCPLRCRWCQNPESLRPQPEVAFYADRCRRSGDCRGACPQDAITEGDDRILRARCDACGRCEPACPYGAFRVVGREASVDQLLEEVLRDQPFFQVSGGGVTLSGGEPTLQMKAAGELARRCRERGVPVGLQTCGLFKWESFAPHLAEFSFIHFDLKLMDPVAHQQLTGVDNQVTLANARRLTEAGAVVQFRMPVVPGLTDGETNLDQAAVFVRGLGARGLHLLRYHRMGQGKLPRLGFPLEPLDLEDGAVATEALSRAADRLRRAGLEVTS
jgi:pyruvate formate lyase activating enzyme